MPTWGCFWRAATVCWKSGRCPRLAPCHGRLSVPAGTSLDAARDEVRALASGADADFNHYYRSEEAAATVTPAVCEGPHCASFDLIGWSAPAGSTCLADITVGVIDTGINPDHPTFATARLEVHKLTPGDLDPSRAVHGTAVTAVLIGDPTSRSAGAVARSAGGGGRCLSFRWRR